MVHKNSTRVGCHWRAKFIAHLEGTSMPQVHRQTALFETDTDDLPLSRAVTAKKAKPLVRSAPNASEAIGPFETNRIHHTDCMEALARLPDESVDVAIADPPYNASKGNNWRWDNSVALPGFGGNWSKVMADWDDMPLGEYFTFCLSWLSQLKRVVRPTGSLWIHGTYHNIGIINFALQMLKIEMINEVVWYKRNSFPNLSGRRLTASHETILWAHTGGEKKRKYHFDYEESKQMGGTEDLLKEIGKQMRTVWDIPNNKKREELALGKHPTQKPVRLLTRMLKLSAKPGDVLLVPFAGSGSDCVAAQELGINFVGFETDETFVRLANARVGNVEAQTVPEPS
jgi:site-specific DNA-methyltransferase (adenine-specific)